MAADHCVLSDLVAYIARQFTSTRLPIGDGNEYDILFNRMSDVYGWQEISKDFQPTTTKIKYKLGAGGYKPRRVVKCFLQGHPHKCSNLAFVAKVPNLKSQNMMMKMARRELMTYLKWLGRNTTGMYVEDDSNIPVGQADIEGADGTDDQVNKPAENTEVTTDTAIETKEVTRGVPDIGEGARDLISLACSTEKYHAFETILNRWVPLQKYVIHTNTGEKGAPFLTFDLPEELKKIACVPNTLPFEQFMYGQFDIDMLFKINATKFQTGRILASVVLDPIGLAGEYSLHWSSGLQRPHVMMDVANTTTGCLHIPWRYHRGLIRNLEHGQNAAGVHGGVYARVELYMVQQVKVPGGIDDTVSLLPFVKLTRAQFAGMAYQVPVAQIENETFDHLLRVAEASIPMLTSLSNLDKPRDITRISSVVPRPRLFFPHGKGLSDATLLHLNPTTSTPYYSPSDFVEMYKDVTNIARQWGFLEGFLWDTGRGQGEILCSWPVDPCSFQNMQSGAYPADFTTAPPLCYMARMYQYWRGSLEFRLEFVSTAYHSGSITIAIEFGRTSSTADFCQSYSSYNKTFDLGEKKVCEITVPYIYDTPVRRLNNIPYHCVAAKSVTDVSKREARTGLVQDINTRVVIRVANSLKAASTVVNPIKVLAYVRAGESFSFIGLIQNNGVFKDPSAMKNFPGDDFPQVKEGLKKKLHPNVLSVQSCASEKSVIENLRKEKEALQVKLDEAIQARATKDHLEAKIRDLETQYKALEERSAQSAASADCERDRQLIDLYKVQIDYMRRDVNYIKRTTIPGIPNKTNRPTVIIHNKYLLGEVLVRNGAYWASVDSDLYKAVLQSGALSGQYKWSDVPVGQAPERGSSDFDGDFSANDDQMFNHGPRLDTVVTSTHETNIYDILRRPVCIIKGGVIKESGKNGPFYIPVLPVQWIYSTSNSVFNAMVRTTPQVALTSLFRFWRGSLRYTFVVTRGSKPIYVAYLPHSGTRYFGNCLNLTKSDDVAFDAATITSTGISTDVFVPYINPTHVVETPYLTENVWTLLNNGNINGNRNWRDLVDDNAGHVVIETMEDVQMDVFLCVGDDFRMTGFIGTAPTKYYRGFDTLTDDAPIGQMDFRFIEGFWNFQDFSQQVLKLSPYVMTGASALSMYYGWWATPIVTAATAVRLTRGFGSLEEVVDSSKEAILHVSDLLLCAPPRISLAADAITTMGVDVSELVMKSGHVVDVFQEIINKIGSNIEKLFPSLNAGHMVTEGLIDVISMCFGGGKVLLGNILCRWLVKLGIITIKHILTLSPLFDRILSFLSTPVLQVSFNGQDLTKLVLEVCVIIINVVTKSCVQLPLTFATKCMQGLFGSSGVVSGFAGVKCVTSFINDIFTLVHRCYYYYFCERDPELELSYLLTERNATLIKFVNKMQYFSAEWNKGEMQMSSKARIDFYATVQMAYLVQSRLVCAGTNATHTGLLNTIAAFLKRANELQNELGSCPVRYEPYVLCLTGGSGIGKSFMSGVLASKLNDDVFHAMSTGELVYTRCPGTSFWDGYKGQPFILFDDFMNMATPEQVVEQCADLYALKSSATFIPNMARVEEKGVKGNPVCVILLTNNPFPDLHEVPFREAVDRRRDWLVKVFKEGDFAEDFSHLKFRPYKSPLRGTDGKGVYGPQTMNFVSFYDELRKRVLRYHLKEQENVQYRFTTMMNSLGRTDYNLSDVDPYALTYAHLFKQEVENYETIPIGMEARFLAYLHMRAQPDVIEYIKSGYGEVPTGHINGDVNEVSAMLAGDNVTPAQAIHALLLPDSYMDHVLLWRKIYDYVFDTKYTTVVEGECSVCFMHKPCVFKCTNSTPDAAHIVCATCYVGIQRASISNTCPVCRESVISVSIDVWYERFETVMTGVIAAFALTSVQVCNLMKSLARLIISGADTLMRADFLISLMLFWQGWYVPASAGILRAAYTTAVWDTTNLRRVGQFTHDMFKRVVATLWLCCAQIGMVFRYNETREQVGLETLDHPSAIAAREVVEAMGQSDNVPYVINLDAAPENGERVCIHTHLLGADMVYYMGALNLWRSYHGADTRVMPNTRCRDEACVLRNEEQVRSVIETLLARSPVLAVWLDNILQGDRVYVSRLPIQIVPGGVEDPLITELQAYATKSWWDIVKHRVGAILKKIAPWCAGVVAFGGVCALIYKLFKRLTGVVDTEAPCDLVESVAEHSQDILQGQAAGSVASYETSQYRRHLARHRPLRHVRHPVGQSGDVNQKYTDIIAKILKNIVQLRFYDQNGTRVAQLSGLGVHSRCVLMPRHYLDFIEKHQNQTMKIWMLRDAGKEIPYQFDASEFTDCGGDIMLWNANSGITFFADITKFFITKEDLELQSVADKALLIVPPTRFNNLGMIHSTKITGLRDTLSVRNPTTNDMYEVDNVLQYTFSIPGACGSVVFQCRGERPILGIHVAGFGKSLDAPGFGAIITKEFIDDHSLVGQIDVEIQELNPGCEARVRLPQDVLVIEEGCVERRDVVFQPTQTQISPSLIQDVSTYSVTKIPVPLSGNDEPYKTIGSTPLIEGCKHHGELTAWIPSSKLKPITEHLTTLIGFTPPIAQLSQPLSIKDAIVGHTIHPYMEPLDLNTSSGYPWVHKGASNLKSEWIEYIRDDNMRPIDVEVNSELVDAINDGIRKRQERVVVQDLFVDALKDERKKIASAKTKGKTRIFCMSPLHLTIITRMYLLPLLASFYNARLQMYHACGINPDSIEWTQLAIKLQKINPAKVMSIDYKNFGPGFNTHLAHTVVPGILEFCKRRLKYTDKDLNVVEMLLMQFLTSTHLMHDYVYTQVSGAPSGSAITTMLNTFVNWAHMLYAFQELVCKKNLKYETTNACWEVISLSDFDKYVYMCAYGDDNIFSVREEIIQYYNMRTIQEFFRTQCGVLITSCKKDAVMPPYLHYHEVDFLQRGFVPIAGVPCTKFLAPLAWDTVQDIALWRRNGLSEIEGTRESCYASILLAYGHGLQKFNDHRNEINRCLDLIGEKPITITWYELDQIFFPVQAQLAVYEFGTGPTGPYLLQDTLGDGEELNQALNAYIDDMNESQRSLFNTKFIEQLLKN